MLGQATEMNHNQLILQRLVRSPRPHRGQLAHDIQLRDPGEYLLIRALPLPPHPPSAQLTSF